MAMVHDNTLWIGSGCGFCHVFKIRSLVDEPQETIQQLAKIKNKSGSQFDERRISRSMMVTSPAKPDASLIGDNDMGLSLAIQEPPPPSPNMEMAVDANRTDDIKENELRFSRQKSFGRTFHRHIKREVTHQGDLRHRDSTIYKLDYVWTGNNVLIENDCSKITVIQPLIRSTNHLINTYIFILLINACYQYSVP